MQSLHFALNKVYNKILPFFFFSSIYRCKLCTGANSELEIVVFSKENCTNNKLEEIVTLSDDKSAAVLLALENNFFLWRINFLLY